MNPKSELNEELTSHQQILLRSIEGLSDGLAIIDYSGKFLFVNAKAAQILSKSKQELTGKSLSDIFPDVGSSLFAGACEQVKQTGNAVTLEEYYEKYDLWISCKIYPGADSLTVYFLDITERKKSQLHIQQSEERLNTLIDNLPDGVVLVDPDRYKIIHVNNTICKYAGYSKTEMIGKHYAFLYDDDDMEQVLIQLVQINKTDESALLGLNLKLNTGSFLPVEVSGVKIRLHGKLCLCLIIKDISLRKRQEKILENELAVLEMISSGAPLPEILEQLVFNIETISQGTIASILLLQEDGLHVTYGAAPSLPDDYNKALEGLPIGPEAGSCGTAMYLNEPIIVTDISNDPLWRNYRQIALQFDLRACWSTPIVSSKGKVLGSFAMYYKEPRSPKEDDFKLIERTTHLASLAIEKWQTEANILLAKTIAENQALILNQAQNIAHIGHWELNLKTGRLDWSDEVFRIFGCEPNEFEATYEGFMSFVHPDDRLNVEIAYNKHITQKHPYDIIHRIVTQNGDTKYVHEKCETTFDENNQPIRSIGIAADITQIVLAEKETAALNQQYKTLFEFTPVGLVTISLSGEVTFVNKRFTDLTGYTIKDCPHVNDWWPLVFQEETERKLRQQQWLDYVYKVQQSSDEQIPPFESKINCKNGEVKIFSIGYVQMGDYDILSFSDITSIKKAQQALIDNEDRFNKLALQSRTVTWQVDQNGLYNYVSSVSKEVYGYNPEEVIGKMHFYDLHPQEGKAEFIQQVFEVFNAKLSIHQLENQIQKKSGEIIWVATYGVPVLNEAGELIGYSGTDTDITEIKLANMALVESERKFRQITENMTDFIWVSDFDLKLSYVSPSVTKLFGYTPEEYLNTPLEKRFTAQSVQYIQKVLKLKKGLINRMHDEQVPLNIELEGIHKNGSRFWMQSFIKLIYDESGVPVGILGANRDITEKKKAEADLRESEERFRSMFYENASPMYLLNPNTEEFIEVNAACERFYGWTRNEFLKKRKQDIVTEPYSIKQRFQLLEKEKHARFEVKYRTASGEIRLMEVFSSVITINGIPMIHEIVHDITERKQYFDALQKQNRVLKDIAWTQSHLVRAPLARMMGLVNILEYEAQLMHPDSDLYTDRKSIFDAIINSAKELDDIIHEIINKTNMSEELGKDFSSFFTNHHKSESSL